MQSLGLITPMAVSAFSALVMTWKASVSLNCTKMVDVWAGAVLEPIIQVGTTESNTTENFLASVGVRISAFTWLMYTIPFTTL